ncbi:DUF2256 domain-containing protein [Fulvimarina endophytica]|uniref:DUF2256 domain-containing protein n=1 Tax=Fulvimarina endophytica TaxID=2293836 RepID=A0A371X4A7_9HYPH|nr:DUF2256 domain-containing protein [Fulvimarina endophytica]RFC64072.1 DUF2256 domain-containing protein [Fulvimarina endophytica]
MTKKSELPVKLCVQCGKPMVWRKKWERNWDEVRYCSQRCRREAKAGVPGRYVPPEGGGED